ncbi:MAG: DUF6970 domain-containing protein [Bacteroidota bacterium]
MKSILLATGFITVLSFQCNKDYTSSSCINNKISQIKARPKFNPPAEVNEHRYKGKRVFLFTADCCDQYNELYDEDCNYICAPSGGITGAGDGKCTDFSTAAQHIRLVWKDDR